MSRVYNDNTGNYDDTPDDPIYTDPPWVPPTPAPAPTTTTTPPPATTTTTTGGKTPAEIEAEGREYDRQHGLIGGYMLNGQWVNGSPHGGATPPPDGGDTGGYDASGFQWPHFNAPTYTPGPAFSAPAPFAFDAFKAPEFGDIFKDPSYTGRRDEGLNAIEHGAAAKGLSRLPQTLKSLGAWNQDFASREYGNIFDRSAQTYGINRNNAADAYSTNYGISRDVWDRNENQNLNAFDRNYKSAFDSFDVNEFQPAKLTFADMFNRYKAGLDAEANVD